MSARFSIALCTFNGARYLPEQLESFLCQTVLPNELVVCDDASADATLVMLREFQTHAPFRVSLYINPVNVGVCRNFEQAIARCTGDWIFLADQDDQWLPEKLAKFREAIAANPDCRFLASDAEVVDASLQSLGYRLWQSVPFPKAVRAQFVSKAGIDSLMAVNRITGATCAFHASLKQLILPIKGNTNALHDYWIALVAAATVPCGLIDTPLIRYRQHTTQQVGTPRMTFSRMRVSLARRRDPTYRAGQAEFFQALHDRLANHPDLLRSPDILDRVGNKIEFCRLQARMHAMNRVRRTALVLSCAFAGSYHRYENGFKGIAADLLL